MILGIKGNPNRGDEVIKILEMMGGRNKLKLTGDVENHFYYINDQYKDINNSYIGPDEVNGVIIFTLEVFLKKFPYKVGDKVNVWVNHEHFSGPRAELEVAEIKSMRWNSARREVAYRMKELTGEFYKSEIKGKLNDDSNKQSECKQCGRVFGSVNCFDVDCPHNIPNYAVGLMDDKVNGNENLFHTTNEYEEIVEKSFQGGYEKCKLDIQLNGYELPDGYHFTDENGNVIDATKIKLVKNSPYYPKSYEECCDVLSMCYATQYNLRYFTYEHGYHEYATTDKLCSLQDKLNIIGKLIICRNAYWKIAGDYLKLDKPWEPDWTNENQHKYGLYNELKYSIINPSQFAFPTEEIRDEFQENFKDLIDVL